MTDQQVRRCAIAAFLTLALWACDGDPVAPASPSQVVGTYDLVEIDGKSLPANVLGRLTYYGGWLELREDLHYSKFEHVQTCVIDCYESQKTDMGTWLLLSDGRIYLDNRESYSFPPSFLRVEGERIFSCPPRDSCAPHKVYLRR